MNAVADHISFASAYRQLRAAERSFVDAAVTELEREAQRNNARISLALYRPIPASIVEQSRGMLEKPMVRAAITERINEIAAANELTVQRVVKELMAMGFASLGNYMVPDPDNLGDFRIDLDGCTPEQIAAIKRIDIEETGDGMSRPKKRKIKIELHDKIGSIKMLAEFMGMLQPDNPFWRADTAQAQRKALPGTATAEEAADAYAAALEGGR